MPYPLTDNQAKVYGALSVLHRNYAFREYMEENNMAFVLDHMLHLMNSEEFMEKVR